MSVFFLLSATYISCVEKISQSSYSHLKYKQIAALKKYIDPYRRSYFLQIPSKNITKMIHACTFENCPLVFDRPWKLKRHEECHLGIKSFVCNEHGCSKSYHTSSHLKRHIKNAHGCKEESYLLYVCSFSTCDASFKTACGLQKHEKKHLFGHFCNVCNRFFKEESVYQRHTLQHQNKRPKCSNKTNKSASTASEVRLNGSYFCEDCCLSFVEKKDFICHCRSLHQPVTSTFHCGEPDCHKEFKHKRNLREHIVCCHLDTSLFICGEAGCTSVFGYKRNIRKHILTKHLNISIQCPLRKCKSTFLFRKSLKHHLEQHKRNLVVERKKRKLKCSKDIAKEICDAIVNV